MGFQTDVVDRFDPLPCAAAVAAVCTNDLEIIQHLLHSFMAAEEKVAAMSNLYFGTTQWGKAVIFLFRK